MVVAPLMLALHNPAMAGLILLLTAIIMILSWNIALAMYLVVLIYISGLLVMLLYLTTFSSHLSQKVSKLWLVLIPLLPFMGVTAHADYTFNMQELYGSVWLLPSIIMLSLFCLMLGLISSLMGRSVSMRSLK